MAPATYLSRTNSRKATAKRKRGSEQASDVDKSDTTLSSSRKRQKSDTNDQATVPEWRVTRESTAKHKTVKAHGLGQGSSTPSPPSHVGPASIARDLSDVFDSVTPSQSPVGTPRKVARRMLARSKTESLLETSPSRGPVLERTPSLPTLPSTPSRDKGKRKDAIHQDATLNPLPPLPLPASNVTRTYGGKSRSFLVTIPASSLGPNALPPNMNVSIGDDEDDYLTRESYSSLRARWGVDNSEDDPYPVDSPNKRRSGSAGETQSGSPSRVGKGSKKGSVPSIPLPPGMMNPLKSITELRSKGENRRFLDEIGYMFEGMSKICTLSLRKTSALDIVTKLCDVEFARKAKAADILGRIWDVFIDAGAGQNEDKILDLLLAFLASLIARDGPSLTELAQRPSGSKAESSKDYTSFVDTLFSILACSTSSATLDLLRLVEVGDVELKRVGLTKKDRAQLALIHDVIASKSHLFPKGTPITTPLLVTYTLQHLPPFLIPSRHLSILLASYRMSLSPLVLPSQRVIARRSSPSRSMPVKCSSSVASHVNWQDLIAVIGFECVNTHLSLLDSYLLGQWQTSSEEESNVEERRQEDELERAREDWLLEALVAVGICAEMRLRSRGRGISKSSECMELVLRILVSRTHADDNWSRTLLQNPFAVTWMVRLVAWTGNTYHVLNNEEGGEIKGSHVDTVTSEEEVDDGEVTRSHRGEEEMRRQDRLCLALGLLANVAQSVADAKDTVRETRVDPKCSLKKSACVRTCCCARPIGGLDVLMRLYTQQEKSRTVPTGHDKDEDEGESKKMLAVMTLLGHMAVLFGLLMRGNRENEGIIVGGLPGQIKGESRKAKLGRLAEHARELMSFDAAVSGDGEIAREVIVFLQELMIIY
ncbi:hypothetical protein APHAL10511_005269 [Amanita phalloides]|nr:hypothetical protein APHAL10511_005269 [Amanita phalloides]